MENLRIVTKKNYTGSYETGDNSFFYTYEVRRDYTPQEDNNPLKLSKDCLHDGVLIESFKSIENAKMFLDAYVNSKKFRPLKNKW